MLVAMICPECGQPMKRVCRACQAQRAYRGLLLHQRRYLRTWLAGAIDLRVRDFNGALHLELFDDRWHAYCGLAMMQYTERRRVQAVPADLCPDCSKVFNELVAKAAVEGTYAR